jgi:hypothetical protein
VPGAEGTVGGDPDSEEEGDDEQSFEHGLVSGYWLQVSGFAISYKLSTISLSSL